MCGSPPPPPVEVVVVEKHSAQSGWPPFFDGLPAQQAESASSTAHTLGTSTTSFVLQPEGQFWLFVHLHLEPDPMLTFMSLQASVPSQVSSIDEFAPSVTFVFDDEHVVVPSQTMRSLLPSWSANVASLQAESPTQYREISLFCWKMKSETAQTLDPRHCIQCSPSAVMVKSELSHVF